MIRRMLRFLISTLIFLSILHFMPIKDSGLVSSANPTALQVDATTFCPGERFSIKTPPLSSEPYIELTVGEKTGPFLVDYAATLSSVEQGLLATGNRSVTLTGPNLPGLPEQNTFAVDDRNIAPPGVGEQLGVIGTDILSKLVVELRLENANDEHLVVSTECDTSELADRGFWRFDQQGFFSAHPADQPRVNVPVLYIDFQKGLTGDAIGAKTWAQIDSGYGDAIRPYSIDINDAYYTRLVTANVPLVEVDRVMLDDCKGVTRTDRVYVMPDHLLRIETPDGDAMYRHASFYLIHKGKGSGQCGGIAMLEEPAAQFGASFLRVFGRMIFDPADQAVWVLPTAFRDYGIGEN